jgi:hypothetical protein
MALEWPAGFMASSGSTPQKRKERLGPPGTPAHDAETQLGLLVERLFLTDDGGRRRRRREEGKASRGGQRSEPPARHFFGSRYQTSPSP